MTPMRKDGISALTRTLTQKVFFKTHDMDCRVCRKSAIAPLIQGVFSKTHDLPDFRRLRKLP